jgi:DNA-binding XRE family transcriptional regulator
MKLGDPTEVGRMMRERRHQMGFTIEQFAQATGVSPITIMRIELGRVGYVHAKTAKALEVPAKIVKRMVMVPTPVDNVGRELPDNGLPPALQTRISGDNMTIRQEPPIRARKGRLHSSKAHIEVHSMSPLKKALLWIANKV